MILSKSISLVLFVSAIICSSFVFLPGDFGDLARSLGVFTLLLLRNFTVIHKFLPKFFRQFSAALMFSSERVPFPPGTTNPWRYTPPSAYFDEDDNSKLREEENIDFSMTNTLLTMTLFGAVLGWNIFKHIPLFPNWLGAIISSLFLSYLTTFVDSRGDLLRFLAFTTFTAIMELRKIANDVRLLERLQLNVSKLFFFMKGVDDQFQLMAWFRYLLREFVVKFSMILYR
jgi:hypothetical protein